MLFHKDLVWLSHNMEQLSQCNTPTAIKYNGNYYMPLKVLSERKSLTMIYMKIKL